MENQKLKTVALVGRPNVGKSTLFNRLVGKRKAIETPIPGTTRDRLYDEVSWQRQNFTLVDLAGIEMGTKSEIQRNVQAGIEVAIENTDLIVFVVDCNEKDNEMDKRVAAKLRRSGKKVILAVNKCDNTERMNNVSEFNRLGNFDIVPVSAISGKSSGDLLEKIIKELKKISVSAGASLDGKGDANIRKEDDHSIKLVIAGRPNVGKSTLLNSIIGEKRAIVSEEPGTTRDVLSVKFAHKGETIKILDTAGIRRRGKIERDSIESFSVLRAYDALKESEIVVIVVDASEGLVATDTHILGQAKEWGKGVILAVNKIDLWKNKEEEMAKFLYRLQTKLNFIPYLPVVFISAKEADNLKPLLNQVVEVMKNRATTIPQIDLDKILDFAKNSNNQLTYLKSLHQKKANPPIFEVKYSGREEPHYTQIRYLENQIRDSYPLSGSPIFIDLFKSKRRQRKNG